MKALAKFIDLVLLAYVLILATIGIVAISSATNVHVLGLTREVKMQVTSLILGLIIMLVVVAINYKYYGDFYVFIYLFGIVLLLLVYVPGLGETRFHARSWIKIGSATLFQTSEIAKIAYIISLAKVLENCKDGINTLSDLALPIAMSIPYFFLIFIQPDFGTMLVFGLIFVGMIFVAKIDRKIIFGTIISLPIILPSIYFLLNSNQRDRINSMFVGNSDNSPAAFHREMSKITIGSGRIWGNGWFQGDFSANNYLPVKESDFIFSVWVEEFGFIGGLGLIFMFFLLLSRIITTAFKSVDNFGSYICTGVLFMFAFQIFENIGMTLGIMPITGITLPFISYGGSSMLINLIAIGLVMNVHFRAKMSESTDEYDF